MDTRIGYYVCMSTNEALELERLRAWLISNDPNGCYTDEDSDLEQLPRLTLDEARRLVADQQAQS
jgi:hypothetical protein